MACISVVVFVYVFELFLYLNKVKEKIMFFFAALAMFVVGGFMLANDI